MTLYEKINSNRDIQFFKEYSSFFILLPTIFAGLKQSLILLILNRNVLTFFSVSQLISDGIVLTAVFAFLVFCSTLYKLAADRFIKKNIYLLIIEWVATIVGFGLFAFAKHFILENYAYAIMYIFVLIFIYTSLILNKDLVMKGLLYLLLLVSVIGIDALMSVDPNEEIRNVKITTEKVREKYPTSFLLYYNDQYLFYRAENTSREILVVKIDEIFNKDFEAR
ncbi:hypothetical protein [Chryseobacterium sp. Leaf313]|uniref:hypothetical protein n=1 Tax=Chryseobacterium sp. Leaf313 TaxID=2876563 RepID=UPI001E2C083D|nr:hypothetical protein [Chryseobacterium sp. Leaf313]